MSTDQNEVPKALDIIEYAALHEKLLPRDNDISMDGERPVVSLSACFTHISFLRWWYIRSEREHMKMIKQLPSLLRQLKATERLYLSKKYFPFMNWNADEIVRLENLCKSFLRFEKKWFRQNAHPADVWQRYLLYAEKFDRKLIETINELDAWNPVLALAQDITPPEEDEDPHHHRKAKDYEPDADAWDEEQCENEDPYLTHHAKDWVHTKAEEDPYQYGVRDKDWVYKSDDDTYDKDMEEWKGYDPPNPPSESDEKYPLRKTIPLSAFKVPDVDDKIYDLLAVQDKEDNKDTAEKQQTRKRMMSKMQTVN